MEIDAVAFLEQIQEELLNWAARPEITGVQSGQYEKREAKRGQQLPTPLARRTIYSLRSDLFGEHLHHRYLVLQFREMN